jgi:hypothetical protein
MPDAPKVAHRIADALRLARNPRWKSAHMIDEDVAKLAMSIFGDYLAAGEWFMCQPIAPYRLMEMARKPETKGAVVDMLRKVGPPHFVPFDTAAKNLGIDMDDIRAGGERPKLVDFELK